MLARGEGKFSDVFIFSSWLLDGVDLMDRGDAGFGLVIAGGIAGTVGALAVVVYVIVTVAKWAWGG